LSFQGDNVFCFVSRIMCQVLGLHIVYSLIVYCTL
jgi:hypothetical protein